MRILNLSMLYPPRIIGGAERSVALLSEALAMAGHTVAAACITPDEAVREDRNGVSVYRMPHETDFWPEEWPQHKALNRAVRRFKMQFNYRLEKHFGDVIDDFKPDIINTHSLTDVSTRVWEAAAARNIPIVHTLRDYDLMCARSAMFKDGELCAKRHLQCRVFTFKKAAHHRHVSAVVGVGAAILNRHIDMGYFGHVPPDLRRVIWNAAVVEGIDANYVKPDLEGTPFTFGYLGRINTEKGVGTLIEACRSLPKDGWRLLIAGSAVDGDNSMQEMAAGLPIDFLGFVSPREFFDQIDTLVVPSIWPEPLPRTILESYAAGVPAIGSRSGGIPDLIGHDNNEWLFTGGEASELATRLSNTMKRGRASLPKRTAFEHVLAETTLAAVVDRYMSLYQTVLTK